MATSRQYLLALVVSLPALALAIPCASLDISHRDLKPKVKEVFDSSKAAGCILRMIFYTPSQPVQATDIQITNPYGDTYVILKECGKGLELFVTRTYKLSVWLLMPDEPLNFTYFCILSNLSCALENKRLKDEFGLPHDVENEKRNASFGCRSGIRKYYFLLERSVFERNRVSSAVLTIEAKSDSISDYTSRGQYSSQSKRVRIKLTANFSVNANHFLLGNSNNNRKRLISVSVL